MAPWRAVPTAPHRRLVLASASPARLGLLRAAGIEPEVRVSGVDEGGFDPGRPTQMVAGLARRKAEAVAAGTSGALVIGCDSVLELDGMAHGKPKDAVDAVTRWRSMPREGRHPPHRPLPDRHRPDRRQGHRGGRLDGGPLRRGHRSRDRRLRGQRGTTGRRRGVHARRTGRAVHRRDRRRPQHGHRPFAPAPQDPPRRPST